MKHSFPTHRSSDLPDLKIMIVSANEAFATEIASFIKQIIDHEAGDDLWAELRAKPGQRQSALIFDVGPAKADKSPSVKAVGITGQLRSEEHTSELQSLMRISYAVFCLKKKK